MWKESMHIYIYVHTHIHIIYIYTNIYEREREKVNVALFWACRSQTLNRMYTGKISWLLLCYPVPGGSSEHCYCSDLYLYFIHCSCQTSTHVQHTAALHITTDAYLSSTVNICRGKTTERGCKVLIINEHNTNGESNLLFACDIETYTLQTHATHHKRTGYLGDRSRETLASASNNQRK